MPPPSAAPARCAPAATRAQRGVGGEHDPEAAPAEAGQRERRREQRERAAGRHVGAPRSRTRWRGPRGCGGGGEQRRRRDHEQHEADAFEEARGEQHAIAAARRRRAAPPATISTSPASATRLCPKRSPSTPKNTPTSAPIGYSMVCDQARLDQGEAEVGAHRGQRRRHLGHVGAGGEAAGEDHPDRGPVGHGEARGLRPAQAAVTGIFSSTIFFDHSAGPVLCTEVPFASTATVTGMSCTSNS